MYSTKVRRRHQEDLSNDADNAIPIEGWISDPTDNDLLNLIPLLEGLQHATDVRALLALRMGQPQDMGEAS
jgi:TFIIF-interacting CTD phosphatase-like protein